MVSQYYPLLATIVFAHILVGVAVVFLKLKPEIDSGEIPDVEGSGFTKLISLFDLYAASRADKGQKSWDYYYARAFKVLHLAVMAIIAVVIVDVGWRQFDGVN